MPSGRNHDRITLWSLPWIIALSLYLTKNGKLTLIVAGAFLFSGLMFGPDLDIYSIQFKRWGQLRWIWLPYQNQLRHRSLLSHGLFVGTTIRVVYFLGVVTLIAVPGVTVGQLFWGFDWNWQDFAKQSINSIVKDYRGEAIALFVGLEIGAMSHSLSDWIGSTFKREQKDRFRKKPKKRSRK
jgi:uncharacterized metal-binding protein